MTIRSSSEWKETTARIPPGLQHRLGGGEPVLDLAKLAVHIDPQRLEASRGRIRLSLARRRHHPVDDRGQPAGGGDRFLVAGADDGAGDAARGALLAVIPQDRRKRLLVQPHHDVGGAVAGFRHPHVERPVEAEGEAALGLVELRRADAEVEGDAVESRVGPGKIAHFGKAAFAKLQPRAVRFGKPRAAGDGVGVAVDGDDAAGGGGQDGLAIAAVSEGGVEIGAAVERGQGGNDFAQEHRRMKRLMPGVRRSHQRLPRGSPGGSSGGRRPAPSRRLGMPSLFARLRASVSRAR